MLTDIVTSDYTTQDTAFALGHGNFGDFRRNLMRGDFLMLPRHATPGRGNGEYRYGHIAEMALHMHLGNVLSREAAKAAIYQLFGKLNHNDTGLRKFNALPPEKREIVMHGGSFTPEEDPFQLSWFVDFPLLVFGEDIISRNAEKPTFYYFNPQAHQHARGGMLADGSVKLADMHAKLVKITTAGAADALTRQHFADTTHVAAVVNLTALFVRLDQLLGIRLQARGPIGA